MDKKAIGPSALVALRSRVIREGYPAGSKRRRLVIESMHKVCGYGAITLAVVAAILGLQLVAAPCWITLLIGAAWVAEVAAFVWLQRKGRCIDIYPAIWGPALEHPGNRIQPIGRGIRRLKDPSHGRS
jgi:hypothetical protein